MLAFLGIDDPFVWGAYVLCLASTVLCVAYGWANWNKGDEPVEQEDVKWVDEEKKAEEEL
jgi:hypothetical protein